MDIGLQGPSKDDKELEPEVLRAAYQKASTATILYTIPYWLLALAVLWIFVAILILTDPDFTKIFNYLRQGLGITLQAAFIGYFFAILIGLLVGVIRSTVPTPPKPGAAVSAQLAAFGRLVLYNLATLYVQLLRGLPMVVVLLLGAFTIVPIIEAAIKAMIFSETFQIRGASVETGIIALAFAYGAFLSETFRAGIQSIDKGQTEAARSLGMTYFMTMRYVVLPQAFRRILPPLGNDMISMIKDSSLVSFLGVNDITQMAKKYVGDTFQYPQTYLVLAAIYLTMTVVGSLLVRAMERRLKQHER